MYLPLSTLISARHSHPPPPPPPPKALYSDPNIGRIWPKNFGSEYRPNIIFAFEVCLGLCCTRTAVRTRTPCALFENLRRTALIQRRKPSSYTLPFVVLYQPLCAGGYPGLQRTSRKAEKRVSPSSDRRHASVAAAGGVQQVPQRAKVSGVLPDIFSSFTTSTAVHTAVHTAVRTFSEFAAHACARSIGLA